MMADFNQRYALIGFGLLIMALGSDGAITISPNNNAVPLGISRVNIMSCASDIGFGAVTWNYVPVGGSSTVPISYGSTVIAAQNKSYAVEQSGDQQINLFILSATAAKAGTYTCSDPTNQLASAQLIVINSDPVGNMTPNAPAVLLFNQSVQMSCSISYTANILNVAVNMGWSKGDPSTVVGSPTSPQYSSSGNMTTATSNITQVPGYVSSFPIFSCTILFRVTGTPPGSANNQPDYSKSIQINSPIIVNYLKPADANSITGAKPGEQVYLGTTVTCDVDGNPKPNYSWLDVANGNTTNTSGVQIWHSGEYKCTAWNTAGSTSASINVTTYTTTAAPTTTTISTSTVTSRSTSLTGSGVGDSTAPPSALGSGGLSDRDKIIVGVVVGVGGALLIVAVTILICCCLKKKNKADRYSSSGASQGTLSKSPPPPPYDDNGHRGPQRSSNPDLVQGYQMDDYTSSSAPYSTAQHHNGPYIDDEGLNYAKIQLDNNPRSRQPLNVAEETNYSDVRLA